MGMPFSLTTGTLTISGAFIDFSTTTARPATSAVLQYRVFPTGAAVGTLPNYSTLSLPRTSPTNNAPSVTFENAAAAINLLTQPQVLGGGNYAVDIQYVVTYTRSGSTLQSADPGNGGTYGYRATFSVLPHQLLLLVVLQLGLARSTRQWALTGVWPLIGVTVFQRGFLMRLFPAKRRSRPVYLQSR